MCNLSSRHKKNGDDPEHPGVFQTELHLLRPIGELWPLVNMKTEGRCVAGGLSPAKLGKIGRARHQRIFFPTAREIWRCLSVEHAEGD